MAWVTLQSLFEQCHCKWLKKFKDEYCTMEIHKDCKPEFKKIFEEKFKGKKFKFSDLFNTEIRYPEWTTRTDGNVVNWDLFWINNKCTEIDIIILTPTNKRIKKQIGKIHDKFQKYLDYQNGR